MRVDDIRVFLLLGVQNMEICLLQNRRAVFPSASLLHDRKRNTEAEGYRGGICPEQVVPERGYPVL